MIIKAKTTMMKLDIMWLLFYSFCLIALLLPPGGEAAGSSSSFVMHHDSKSITTKTIGTVPSSHHQQQHDVVTSTTRDNHHPDHVTTTTKTASHVVNHHPLEPNDVVPSDAVQDCLDDPTLCEEQHSSKFFDAINNSNNTENGTDPTVDVCKTDLTLPGCSDPFCKDRICNDLDHNQCCDVAWTMDCVTLASAVCIPAVYPVPTGVSSCPMGFVCNKDITYMSNCSDIRQLPIALKLGDIYAGVTCPEGVQLMQNCREGEYCPTPTETHDCPEGWYCSHKSAKPWIECSNCEEGSTSIRRDTFGYIVFGVGTAILAILVFVSCFRRYKKDLWDKQADLLANQVDSVRIMKRRKEKMAQLDRLKPQLEIISKRLAKLEGATTLAPEASGSTTGSLGSFLRDSSTKTEEMIQLDKQIFNAARIFNFLDTNQDGKLSYEELNTVLGLEDVELRNFVRRMQELGGQGEDSTEVSRSIFTKYFLNVLEENSHLHITAEEAAEVYDEILEENSSTKLKERMLYSSSFISRILTDQQIYMLSKKFRAAMKTVAPEESGPAVLQRTSRFSSLAVEQPGGTIIPRNVFIDNYPHFLLQVITADDATVDAYKLYTQANDTPGVDICFKNLCLSVHGADRTINVVNDVTGRVEAKTMTALLGGSGAGKTSLLNALCGRAYYGEVHGDIHINGHKMLIEEIKDCVGFVPQDDIVYAELTVRENFVYAGKFRLPKGTSSDTILELAEETLANLGLSRVADSLVGDVKRRGVSGGEKKRVNIGLELMAKPSCLFLDEPTSGLDASSALLVMSSLKQLVKSQGVTVVSVIHQPRKFIFDLFDSLILLGVGGRMVYHGPTSKSLAYFNSLGYDLPQGESVADWLIDISSGRLEPDRDTEDTSAEKTVEYGESVETVLTSRDQDVVGRNGVSTGKAKDAFEEAKTRRAWLYEKWNGYFEDLDEKGKSIYNVPPESKLPEVPKKPSFLFQVWVQTARAGLVAWRNSFSKSIDTLILAGATIVITLSDGVPQMTRGRDPDIPFNDLINPSQDNIQSIIGSLFAYAARPQWQYPLKIGIIVAVLIGLQATRIVTSKKLEFFREASSGYNINAYYLAINIVSTLEHFTQILIISFFAAWLREPIAGWWSFFIHFLALTWICVSWALFFPMVVPPDNVVVVIGFFMAFCGLMISGAFPPVTWKAIYEEGGLTEQIAGWFSPTRYFFEGLTVGDYRCMPQQSGLTVADSSVNFNRNYTVLHQMGLAGHDPNATQMSCHGWYWGILPSILVGLTVRYAGWLAMHTFNRPQQTKKSLLFDVKRDKRLIMLIVFLLLVFACLAAVTSWSFTHDKEPNYEQNDPEEHKDLMEELLSNFTDPGRRFLVDPLQEL